MATNDPTTQNVGARPHLLEPLREEVRKRATRKLQVHQTPYSIDQLTEPALGISTTLPTEPCEIWLVFSLVSRLCLKLAPTTSQDIRKQVVGKSYLIYTLERSW